YLGKFGANLSVLRADFTNLSDSNINCYLQDIGTFVVCRLDRLDVSFQKLHELGADSLGQILAGAWKAVHGTDKTISIARHEVTANVHTQIMESKYDEVISRFVKATPELAR